MVILPQCGLNRHLDKLVIYTAINVLRVISLHQFISTINTPACLYLGAQLPVREKRTCVQNEGLKKLKILHTAVETCVKFCCDQSDLPGIQQ